MGGGTPTQFQPDTDGGMRNRHTYRQDHKLLYIKDYFIVSNVGRLFIIVTPQVTVRNTKSIVNGHIFEVGELEPRVIFEVGELEPRVIFANTSSSTTVIFEATISLPLLLKLH